MRKRTSKWRAAIQNLWHAYPMSSAKQIEKKLANDGRPTPSIRTIQRELLSLRKEHAQNADTIGEQQDAKMMARKMVEIYLHKNPNAAIDALRLYTEICGFDNDLKEANAPQAATLLHPPHPALPPHRTAPAATHNVRRSAVID